MESRAFFFCPRDMADINIRQIQNAHNLRAEKEKEKSPAFRLCAPAVQLGR